MLFVYVLLTKAFKVCRNRRKKNTASTQENRQITIKSLITACPQKEKKEAKGTGSVQKANAKEKNSDDSPRYGSR